MSDRFEDDLRDWLRERGEAAPAAMSAVVARIDTLPSRRRLPSAWLAAAAAVVVVVVVIGVGLVAPRLGGTSAASPAPRPPDPAAFPGDPRLGRCLGGVATPEFVFVMPHARDYQRHFPAMGLSPELDVVDPAFVVVFAADASRNDFPLTGGSGAGGSQATPAPSAGSGSERFVCIMVGDTPNLYEGVDITGMRVDIGTTENPVATPSTAPSPSSGQTPEPAPSWAADLVQQLECDAAPQTIGGDTGEIGGEDGSPESPAAAVAAFTAHTVFTSVPAGEYEQTNRERDWARFEHRVGGKVKAVLVLSDTGPDNEPGTWAVVGLRACDPSEFDPAAGLTGELSTVWRDADERLVNTGVVHEIQGPEHCGWESTTWLRLDGTLYIRDPKGVLRAHTVGKYDGTATLPKAARSTGYHDSGRTIWRTTDTDAIYVVLDDHVERWPRAKDSSMGCA